MKMSPREAFLELRKRLGLITAAERAELQSTPVLVGEDGAGVMAFPRPFEGTPAEQLAQWAGDGADPTLIELPPDAEPEQQASNVVIGPPANVAPPHRFGTGPVDIYCRRPQPDGVPLGSNSDLAHQKKLAREQALRDAGLYPEVGEKVDADTA